MTYNEIEKVVNDLKIDANNFQKHYVVMCGKGSLEQLNETLEKFDVTVPVIVDTRIDSDSVYLIKDWELRSTLEFDIRKLGGK